MVIDKPAGLVVHPGAGNREGTLQNALLHHDPQLAELPRSGIVHRLDKDTSGLMVVARSLAAHTALVAQLQARSVRREYLALVNGCPVAGGTVEAPIGRHPRDRKRMAVVERGRPATTHYRVEERLAAHTLLRCFLETGRTHQIRVHMAHAGYPLVGDPVYGGRLRLPPRATEAQRQALRAFQRQALHAARLALDHPESGERLSWEAPCPKTWPRCWPVCGPDTPGAGASRRGHNHATLGAWTHSPRRPRWRRVRPVGTSSRACTTSGCTTAWPGCPRAACDSTMAPSSRATLHRPHPGPGPRSGEAIR